jgi:hypothetical protein
MALGNSWPVLTLLLPLAGCMTDQPAPSVIAGAPGMAMLTVSRPVAMYGLAVNAEVTLNGAHFASLGSSETYSASVPPGPAVLTVSCWCSPGSYTVKFDAETGKTYAFAVSPRGEQFAAGMAGAVVGGGFGSLVGVGMDTSANGEQSGTFQITAEKTTQ